MLGNTKLSESGDTPFGAITEHKTRDVNVGNYSNNVQFETQQITLKSVSTWCVQVLRSPKEAFAKAMQSWRERCEKCVCLQGDYVEK